MGLDSVRSLASEGKRTVKIIARLRLSGSFRDTLFCSHSFQEILRVEWADGGQIGVIEGGQQIRFVNVQQVMVGCGEHGNASQGGFGQDLAVVDFFLWQQAPIGEPMGELFGYSVPDRHPVEPENPPLSWA